MDGTPKVSIAIATFQRPDLLRRAVESIRAQTLSHWEAVISDDEAAPGDVTWRYLLDLAERDPRFRPVRNFGPHGEVWNRNCALKAATAPWIKILDDDDELVPDCLEKFCDAASRAPSAVMICCTANFCRSGNIVRTQRRGRARVELLSSGDALRAMYFQEAGPGQPSLTMVHRSVVDDGVLFQDVPELVSGFDSDWGARVVSRGDLVLINEPLVNYHQGAHSTITTRLSEEALDADYVVLRRRYLDLMDASLKRPPLATVVEMLMLIRAANRLKKRRFSSAVRLLIHARRPHAWWLAFRWSLQQVWPGRFRGLRYLVLDDRRPVHAHARIDEAGTIHHCKNVQ